MHVDVVRRIKTNFKIEYFNKKILVYLVIIIFWVGSIYPSYPPLISPLNMLWLNSITLKQAIIMRESWPSSQGSRLGILVPVTSVFSNEFRVG